MLFWVLGGILLIILYCWKSGHPKEQLQGLIQKCATYAVQAQQDTSPVQAMLHANYSAAYLDVLKTISTEKQLQQVGSINIGTFESHILNVQKTVTDKVLQEVPEFAGKVDLYLQSVANPQVNWAATGRTRDTSSERIR